MPRKSPPNSLKIPIQIPAAAAGTYFCDISQLVSIMNRKSMRQGLNWVVSNLEVITNGDATVNISKLPDTWVLSNSWVKSFKLWQESQDQVLDIEGRDILGKYADFKIFYDATHQAAGVAGNLIPYGFIVAAGGATYKWDPTTYQVPYDPAGGHAPREYNIHAIGPTVPNTSLGMIAGYAASRARPQQTDPNIVDHLTAEDWMTALFDVGENLEEIRTDIEDDNDAPPYLLGAPGSQLEYYPGGTIQAATYQSFTQDILVTRNATSLAMDSTGPFLAPCGLIRIDIVHGTVVPTLINFFIELAAGPVKGFLSEPMQEMN